AEDHDGELEPLDLVYAHDPDALGACLDDRRFRCVAALCLGGEPVDERAEAARAGHLETASQIEHAEDVCQRLFSRGPQGDTGMGARRVEQPREGGRDRPAVALPMQLAEQRKGVEDGGLGGTGVRRPGTKRMQPSMSLAEEEQRVVAQREERPFENGEYCQL